FVELAEADPDNADTGFQLIHAQYDLARLERDLGQFSEAAAGYRRAIASLSQLADEHLSIHPSADFLRAEILRRDLADCLSAPEALADLALLRTKPIRIACPLLLTRVRLLTGQARVAEALDTVEAICCFGAERTGDFAAVIAAIGECVRILDSFPSVGLTDTR